MKENEKEPTLEEYGLTTSSYESYRNQKRDLEDLLPVYSDSLASLLYISLILMLVGIFSMKYIFFGIGILIFIIYTFFDNHRQKEFQEKRLEINNKIELLKNKVLPFEQASVKFYQKYLNQFFEENLYKKRSGSEKFEQSLNEFSSMVDEVEEINKKLIFTNIQHYHKSYLTIRQGDHNYQRSNKFRSFDEVKIPKESISLVSNNVINIGNKEESKKEITKPISPEKRYGTIINWEEIHKRRKGTGDKGEEIVYLMEKEHFRLINRNDLAEKVRHVSLEQGDGLGYDILSFFENGKEKYIEVKSTEKSIESSFYLSKNELQFLKEHPEDSFIYRVLVSSNPPEYKPILSDIVLKNEITPVSFIVRTK